MSRTPAKTTALLAVLQLTAFHLAVFPIAGSGAWLTATLSAQSSIDSLVPPQPTGYVSDLANVLDAESRAAMTDLVERLRGTTGAEIAVVTLPSIGDHEASEVALAIGRKWGVGARAEIGDPRRNAGIVLLLVPRREGEPNSGQIRIEVGQGLEGIVTDAAAGQVRDLMRPSLSEGKYGEGLLLGVRALASLIARGYGVSDSALTSYQMPSAPGASPTIGNLFPILFFLLFILLASGVLGGGRRRRRGVYWGGPWIGGGWGGGGGFGGGGGGFGGFGGGGGFSGGGAGGRF